MRFTFVAINHVTHRALHNSDPFFSSQVVVFGSLLLPEATNSIKLLMSRSLHQAALLDKSLHISVNFMIDLCGLNNGIRSSFPLHDLSQAQCTGGKDVVALLACSLIELFLDI